MLHPQKQTALHCRVDIQDSGAAHTAIYPAKQITLPSAFSGAPSRAGGPDGSQGEGAAEAEIGARGHRQ